MWHAHAAASRGQQHLPQRALRKLPRCAASLLMGCSSGRLAARGRRYEPSGPVLAYLIAGEGAAALLHRPYWCT
jgi:separase